MHFSIPDTQLFNSNGSSYMGFNIHVNGAFHCILRFRQLHYLHDQLRKAYPNRLPIFPPKKLLPLSLTQLEDRRTQLERYLQLVGQDPIVSKGYLLNNFLLTAQHELAAEKSREISLDIYLPHGVRRVVQVTSTWSAPAVLNKVCEDLGLQKEFVDNFSLYLARILKDGELELVRRLQAFEAPHLSLRQVHKDCNVHLRRSYWDAVLDDRILSSNVALGLLYVQAVGDVERGWITCKDTATLTHLEELQNGGFTKEYLHKVRDLPTYGSLRFLPCACDYPEPGNISTATFSPRTITIVSNTKSVIRKKNGERKCETSIFPVTRIRCWRLTSVHINDDDLSASSSNDELTPGDSSTSKTYTPRNLFPPD
ncbi:sorting nexin-17 [Ctenocephalides felis]|uniref:sorting nexin-17 n=1 Tax=Ctenocephalides felis TaxID=7515 RepID=UPI000E6E1546|nr:sorting nexin-17 [Ctenocephalides felis]